MLNQRPQTSIDPANPHGFYTGMPSAIKSVGAIPLNTLQAIPGAFGSIVQPTASALGQVGNAVAAPAQGFYARPTAPAQLPLNAPPPGFIQPS